MTIKAAFTVQRKDFRLEVDVELPATGVTALFGPSGCGKTTLLRAMAGLERCPGHFWLDDQCWQSDGFFMPTHKRRLGYVFQEASLFAHLSVQGNLDYGWRRLPVAQRRDDRDEIIDWLGLGPLLRQRATELSGGQRQRVAIGRALLTSPRLLLLDEPLSALDTRAKREILPLLERLSAQARVPVFYVTHAPEEVERLADRVLLMERGRITHNDSLQQALARPRSPLFRNDEAAAILEGRLEQTLADGRRPFDCDAGRLWLAGSHAAGDGPARLRILASDVSVALTPVPDISILNQLPARVQSLTPNSEGRVLLMLKLAGGQQIPAQLSAYSVGQLQLTAGSGCYALIKAAALVD
ncbi:molybdenum ABC transporter ATP-binding protein [Oceanisphaera arctica]|uniref:Molybdenum ABC transporter ATP-binding protein n=1 Tax=Oceanisphaera arctica TaxID=641510 RepID=A0A2P5TLJ5_9GAMM|nr:molybdenum ABC transporter ATP-binding protein [Oceanisphaera arctica]PPL16208.1 molybdenum ABC transporter ATP-binding protein [Oceanisphaera arctica]GHA11448.1 molybdenum import ATP-binding protein ModC [Oceanisphaera arctica]